NGNIHYLSESYEKMRMLGWSRDSDGVFFVVQRQDFIELRYGRLDGNGVSRPKGKMPFARLEGIVLSPEQKMAAFSARRDETDNVYLISTDSGEASKLTSNEDSTLFYSGISWSPDGKRLFYSKQTGGAQISLITNSN